MFESSLVISRLLQISTVHLTSRLIKNIYYYATLESFYDLWNVYRPFQDCHLCNYLQKYEWSQEIINESKLHIWGLYQEHANSSLAKFDISYFILVFHISCKTIKFSLVNEQILLIIHAHIIPFGRRYKKLNRRKYNSTIWWQVRRTKYRGKL